MPSTTFIGNLFDFPARARSLLSYRNKQQQFLRKHILPDLESARLSNDGSLDDDDYKKIMTYYGLAIPAILGESIALLRGKALTERERFALTYLGAITGLFDDFFDKQFLADEKIKALLEQPGTLVPQNANEKLFLHFYKLALQHAHDPALVLTWFRKVYDAQIESKKQAEPGLSREDIFRITIHKGAVSVLFYRASMEHTFLPGEEDALYKMGGLMQFGNDIFDVYKDQNGGIHTLLTTTVHIDEIRKMFIQSMNEGFAAIAALAYSPADKKKYFRMFSVCLISRCFVCFDQLESKEKLYQGAFQPGKLSRQDLVCDMEKKSNLWKSLVYHLRQKVVLP